MMLMLFAATGPVASATDLGAGEKERVPRATVNYPGKQDISPVGQVLGYNHYGVLTSIALSQV